MVDWTKVGKILANAFVVGATAALSQLAAGGFSGEVDWTVTLIAAGITGALAFLTQVKAYFDEQKEGTSNMTTSGSRRKKSYLTLF